ncbi:RIP metalloprotease RseP [Akkermansiaceae bacterium]|nr:RIP metalloprotease RseP [Akkermansiaceae bacterium]
MDFIKIISLIILVILIFNFVIFIHELGHFLAAKWRGMHVDRFQIWFGKPIWKKTIGGVQYGLGWFPAGGFVSLPQMATMEAIEGNVEEGEKKNLTPAKPLDKIIVAAAGPLFSFLLAFGAACLVWVLGTPDEKIMTTTIGYVVKDSPAQGILQVGDKILEIEGKPMYYWQRGGTLSETVTGAIVLSEGDTVEFKVLRDGKELELSTGFTIPDVGLLGRSYRKVGIDFERPLVVDDYFKQLNSKENVANTPAELGGLEKGDRLLSANGQRLLSPSQLDDIISNGEPVVFEVQRGDLTLSKTVTLQKPEGMDRYLLGVQFAGLTSDVGVREIIHPDPFTQCKQQVSMMWTTISKVISPKTDINAGHMNSFVGIADNYYQMLKMDYALNRILWFTVLLNINLAILNLLPLPVLDGGHITTSLIEIITRRPVPAKIMLVLQNAFVLLLLGFMLVLATKDIFGIGQRQSNGTATPKEIIFVPPVLNESSQ